MAAVLAIGGAVAAVLAIIPSDQHATQGAPHSKTVVINEAVADANILNSLRAGELFSAFQSSLKVSPTVNVWGRSIQIKSDFGSSLISDYLFVLHTVYVEAFVGSNGTVDAYTITARTVDMPQGIKILGYSYGLGKTTLADAPLTIAQVAAACGAHIVAYYEISNTGEMDLNQTVAVGITLAGSLPHGYNFGYCNFGNTDSLPVTAGAPGYNPQTGYYRIEERLPTAAYLAGTVSLRRKLLINTITITAGGYPVIPEMISLHPDEVFPYAPKLYG
jgi:hypothetical protein